MPFADFRFAVAAPGKLRDNVLQGGLGLGYGIAGHALGCIHAQGQVVFESGMTDTPPGSSTITSCPLSPTLMVTSVASAFYIDI